MMSNLVSITTSVKVCVIGLWPNRKAFKASDQKYEEAINKDSCLAMFDKERVMHWLILY